MSDQIFYLFSALLLGLVIGALIMYFATGSNKDSEQTIAKLEKELESYQQDVVDHFEQTADLVDGMTKSYKKVFDHLGKSARKLMTEEQIQKQLESRRGNKVTLEYLNNNENDSDSSELISAEKSPEIADDADMDNSNKTTEFEIAEDKSIEHKPDETSDLVAKTDTDNSNELDSKLDETSEEDLEKEVELREKNIYS